MFIFARHDSYVPLLDKIIKLMYATYKPLTPYVTTILGTIRKTCPCNVYPLKPHFYIVKFGYAEVYLFFLFLHQNIDCGYSLETPR